MILVDAGDSNGILLGSRQITLCSMYCDSVNVYDQVRNKATTNRKEALQNVVR
jgi:hypothetical protein